MTKSMYDLGAEYRRLLDIASKGFDTETGEVLEQEAMEACFKALEGAVEDKVAGTAQVIRRLAADAAEVSEEASRLAARARSIENAREYLKNRLRSFMLATETQKVKTPFVTVSIGKPTTRVVIYDESEVPQEYKKTYESVMKSKVKEDIENRGHVPGARLESGPERLIIR